VKINFAVSSVEQRCNAEGPFEIALRAGSQLTIRSVFPGKYILFSTIKGLALIIRIVTIQLMHILLR